MNNQSNNTHAVLYTRVSTSEQATTGFSLRDQEDRLRHHCQQKGIKVVAHFEEDHSAKTFDRPEWKKLMRYLEANHGEIDQVLVVRWDRFSRDFTDASQMIRRLDEDFGVIAQAIEQPIDHDVPEQLPMLALSCNARGRKSPPVDQYKERHAPGHEGGALGDTAALRLQAGRERDSAYRS